MRWFLLCIIFLSPGCISMEFMTDPHLVIRKAPLYLMEPEIEKNFSNRPYIE